MLGKDFEKLNVGDYCTFRTGYSKGTKCKVLWKEGEYALVGSLDGNPLITNTSHHSPYRLANYNLLANWNKEES